MSSPSAGLSRNLAEPQQVDVVEVVGAVKPEIVVTDIAAAKDSRVAVDDDELIVHAGIEALHLGDHFSGAGPHIAALPRVEYPELEVGVVFQLGDHLVRSGGQQVVYDQADMYPRSAARTARSSITRPLLSGDQR